MPIPEQIKIFHIVHVDRLASIVEQGGLWSGEQVGLRGLGGSDIGISGIKQRRLSLPLKSCPGLFVGQCVPFYFCPRSVMLYLLHCGNHPTLKYVGGQDSILHLQADMRATVAWANQQGMRWAFTSSNAGSRYFEDWCDLADLGRVNWAAVRARHWSGMDVDPSIKEGKQAEFLLERFFPWHLVEGIAAKNHDVESRVLALLPEHGYRPKVAVKLGWYY